MVELPAGPSRWLILGALAVVALLGNLYGFSLFFGIHLLLGSSIALFAMLLHREAGLAIAVLASFMTLHLWGHPWAILVFGAEALFVYLIAQYRARSGKSLDDGTLIVADMLFWLLLGIPIAELCYGQILNLDDANVHVVSVKQAVNGVGNSALALVLYLAIGGGRAVFQGKGAVSIRGVTFAIVFLCILVPSFFLSTLISSRSFDHIQELERQRLSIISIDAVRDGGVELDDWHLLLEHTTLTERPIDVRFVDSEGQMRSTSPELFQRIEQEYAPDRALAGRGGITVRIPQSSAPLLQRWNQGYWVLELPAESLPEGYTSLEIVSSARGAVARLHSASTSMLAILGTIMLFGILAAWTLSARLAHEFERVLHPREQRSKGTGTGTGTGTGMALLSRTSVRELNTLIQMLNDRIVNVNELTQCLRITNDKLQKSKDAIQQLSITDSLTQCLNRGGFDLHADEELQRCQNIGAPLSCILMDLDFFKRINDSYGHQAGDKVLVSISQILRREIRNTDILGRIGGEEFALLLPFCPMEQALRVAEELRQLISNTPIDIGEQLVNVTTSMGVAELRSGEQRSDLIHRADLALYESKQHGRNRVTAQSKVVADLEHTGTVKQTSLGPSLAESRLLHTSTTAGGFPSTRKNVACSEASADTTLPTSEA